jgi:hypothetical protein
MKKILLSLSVSLLVGTAFSQQRMVLTESFSQASCGPCASQNPALEALMAANPTKVVAVKYQVSWPGADPMNAQNPTEIAARDDYYGITGVPDRVLDGTNMNVDQAAIDTRYAVPSPVNMTVSHVMNSASNTVNVIVSVTAPAVWNPSNTVMQLAMIERNITFTSAPGSNGETEFHNVMRKMLPSPTGTAVTASNFASANGTQTFTFTGVAIPTYIYNPNEIGFVAWVQNNTTKEVYQAGYSAPIPLPNSGSIQSITATAYSCGTALTGAVAVLKNIGANTITSATVNYKIDNGTVLTAPYSGSLTVGSTANFSIPATTCSSGGHTLTVYLTNINGNGNTTPQGSFSKSFATISAAGLTGDFSQNFTSTAFPYANYYVTSPQDKNWVRSTANTGSIKYDCYMFANGSIGEVYLAPINLSSITNPSLTFSVAHREYSTAYSDVLEVEVSTNCGATWTNIYSKAGAQLSNAGGTYVTTAFTPVAANWRVETVNISSVSSASSALFKFKATSNYGNNIYVDNINIIGTASLEALTQTSFNVYPNPASDLVNISFEGENTDYSISLMDIQGRVISSREIANASGEQVVSFSTENVAKGSYIVTVTSNGEKTTKNVVIK